MAYDLVPLGLSTTALVYIVAKEIYTRVYKNVEIITTANIHDKVGAILLEKNVITVDKCQKLHKEQEEKLLNEVTKKLDVLCSTNRMIVKFLAKQCTKPEDFAELIDIKEQ